jgi:sulfotransferase
LHFIAGLPRSGSTLLVALLRQNPRFAARISSPLCGLFGSMIGAMSGEGAAFISDRQRERILRGLFEAYYAEAGSDQVVFDTNRMWCARLPALVRLHPDARVICMVRNVAWVMDSIERLIRQNALLASRLFGGEEERATVYSRVEALAQRGRLVGASWCALKEAFYSPEAGNLLIVEYEYLTRAPDNTMRLIYEFIGEVPFAHDFSALSYDEPEFDEWLTTPGLHRVRPEVRFAPRRTLLPPDLFQRFEAQSFWNDATPSLANIVAPRKPRAAEREAAE